MRITPPQKLEPLKLSPLSVGVVNQKILLSDNILGKIGVSKVEKSYPSLFSCSSCSACKALSLSTLA